MRFELDGQGNKQIKQNFDEGNEILKEDETIQSCKYLQIKGTKRRRLPNCLLLVDNQIFAVGS